MAFLLFFYLYLYFPTIIISVLFFYITNTRLTREDILVVIISRVTPTAKQANALYSSIISKQSILIIYYELGIKVLISPFSNVYIDHTILFSSRKDKLYFYNNMHIRNNRRARRELIANDIVLITCSLTRKKVIDTEDELLEKLLEKLVLV